MFRPLPFRASWWHWGCCAPRFWAWTPWHQQPAAREHRCKDARRSVCPPQCGAASSCSRINSRWKRMRQNQFYPHIGGRYSIINNKLLTHLPTPQLVPCSRRSCASACSRPPRTMATDGSSKDVMMMIVSNNTFYSILFFPRTTHANRPSCLPADVDVMIKTGLQAGVRMEDKRTSPSPWNTEARTPRWCSHAAREGGRCPYPSSPLCSDGGALPLFAMPLPAIRRMKRRSWTQGRSSEMPVSGRWTGKEFSRKKVSINTRLEFQLHK